MKLKEPSEEWKNIVENHYKDNYRTLVLRYTFASGGEQQAEDIVHDSYERALRYGTSFSGNRFSHWFSTILRNSLRDYKKAERGITDFEELDELEHEGAVCEGYSNKIWEELEERIDSKSPEHAEVLRLFFLKGYTYKDISRVTDNTYHNAFRIVERFKSELIKIYKEE